MLRKRSLGDAALNKKDDTKDTTSSPMKTNIEEEVENVENPTGARKKLDLNDDAGKGAEGANSPKSTQNL
jgi:hypothetical protein